MVKEYSDPLPTIHLLLRSSSNSFDANGFHCITETASLDYVRYILPTGFQQGTVVVFLVRMPRSSTSALRNVSREGPSRWSLTMETKLEES